MIHSTNYKKLEHFRMDEQQDFLESESEVQYNVMYNIYDLSYIEL